MATSAKIDAVFHARDLEERRLLGAYYTPERLSQILSDWAIREASDTVLEPSFGGCGFLAAARNALAQRGCVNSVRQIYGCDIDPIAFQYLSNVFGAPLDTSGFVLRDFLDCAEVETWPARFSVVLANPPYIPHHGIGKARLRELWSRPQGIHGVRGRAGLWAYFLSHAVNLLETGGRMAWVLPGAFLQADYAQPIRQYLGERFDRCAAFLVRERLFLSEGTDEETVILLADGHRPNPKPGGVEIGEANTLSELENLIKQWTAVDWAGVMGGFSPAALSMADNARDVHAALARQGNAVALGVIAKVQIGLVTGDNSFFVLDRPGRESAGLAETDCLRVLSKFKAAPGIGLASSDLDAYADKGGRIFLVSATDPRPGSQIAAYLDTFDAERRSTISTFRKRSVWSATSDGKVPDAFLPVMHHTGPRLVLNPDRHNCTNTIHRVFFLGDPMESQRRLAALSMLTTFTQISAELHGRRYGSGVLKHEPRDAERIELLFPSANAVDIDRAYAEADACLRRGDADGARMIADTAVLGWAGLALTEDETSILARALVEMRARRRPDRQLRSSDRSTYELAPLSR